MELDLTNSYQAVNASFVGLKKKENKDAERSHVFYFAGSERSCLSCFISLRLETAAPTESGQSRSSVVQLLWSYPLAPAEVFLQFPNIGKFALAHSGRSYAAEQLTYTFVLTDSNGVRKYGHCTAFVNGEAVVSVSPYPWCNFFYRLAYLYRTNGPSDGQKIVKSLCRCSTPPSGAAFLMPMDLGVKFFRPYDRLCSFIDTSPLQLLTVFPDNDTLFSVLADLLLEKHVIVVGPNFAVVSNVVMSLQALIAPFDWMHILIPILPSDLLDVLAAPPPYLIGMLTSQLPLVDRVPVDSVVMVRLGTDGICGRVEYHCEEQDHLPHSGAFSALRIGLSLLRLRDPRDQTVRDLCSLFLTYYASLFGEVVLKGATGYIKAHNLSPKTVVFYEKLLSTQSFNVLSEEVNKMIDVNTTAWLDNEFIVATIRAHPDIYPNHHAQLINEEKSGGGYLEKHEDCFGSGESFNSLTAAIHGFGGHKLGVSRLLTNCICGRLCGHLFHGEEDDYEEASYNFFRGSMAEGGVKGRRRLAGMEAPVIETLELATPDIIIPQAASAAESAASNLVSSPVSPR